MLYASICSPKVLSSPIHICHILKILVGKFAGFLFEKAVQLFEQLNLAESFSSSDFVSMSLRPLVRSQFFELRSSSHAFLLIMTDPTERLP